jgi:hypothetical protein
MILSGCKLTVVVESEIGNSKRISFAFKNIFIDILGSKLNEILDNTGKITSVDVSLNNESDSLMRENSHGELHALQEEQLGDDEFWQNLHAEQETQVCNSGSKN